VSATTTSTSAALRERCRDAWEALLAHPFVEEVAAGTLPLAKFAFYLEQDLVFLEEYARATGAAVSRTRGEDELRDLTRQLATVVEEELAKERDLLARVRELLGTSPREIRPAATTIAYTNFLLATAARGDALDVLAAQLPCAWSYADIGSRHLDRAADHPVYADWMRFFGGTEYHDYVAHRRAAFDTLARRAGPARQGRLQQLFVTGTRLERAFWDMAYTGEDA
jgi:thiaminase (transcriptional activator TenA)